MSIKAEKLGRSVPTRVMAPQRYRMLAWSVGTLIVLMAVAETVGFLAISRHQAQQNEVRAENRSTRQLLQYLVDAETGLRGFLITHKPQFLEPYHSGVRAIDMLPSERLLELDASGTQHDVSTPRFSETLHRLRDLWAIEIDEVSGSGDGHLSTEQALNDGKRLMDTLRARIAEMMDRRDVRIAKLDERMSSERAANLILILLGTVTGIAAVTYAFDRAIRDGGRRDRAVQVGAEASRRTRLLSAMAEMLQSAVDRDDASEVLRASATRLLPGMAGALYVFNNSRDRLDLSTEWPDNGECSGFSRASPVHIAPTGCWALKRGKPHRNEIHAGSLRCTHCDPAVTSLEIPMAARGELYGLLQLTTSGEDAELHLDGVQEVAAAIADAMSLALSSIALREQLRSQALRDPLTGLYNRRFMEEMLERFTKDSERKRLPTSVIMIDLDNFKLLNDRYGHPVGDAVLRQVANTISSFVRGPDVACRVGGEEMMILMPDCGLFDAEAKAEQLRVAIAALSSDGSVPPVTASFGVASRPETTARAEDLMIHADSALYAAKKQGRNVVVSSPIRQGIPTLVAAEGG